ncbi:type III secretion outermembrane contact sensing protein [Proteus hauseri ATCC 700826]|uniref:Type III secretion outermembrane contact sensing protein n=1 Tax=Proteus hauseri ATCC 700826 TaxID=1354271 RepID=A0AAJ3LSG6_PROHU|nr:type III secretion system gatekeeper subunit SctW [Proteus hauseri]OAT44969.1 type III secretion outermembrane contact sensing protein [Proteus hauseri ATCC 700826]
MIGSINSTTSTTIATKESHISKKSQQETEYKQPNISEKQNYQNQLAEIADDMSMVATQFSQNFSKRLDRKADKGKNTLYITEEGADRKLNKVMMMFKKSGRSLQELLSFLRKIFPDESDLIMALRELLRKKKLGAQLDAGIENEINYLLNSENAKNIRAGINVALQAKTFAKLLSLNPSSLRGLYRNYLNLDLDPIYFFKLWINEYDITQCNIILNFLTQSLVCDMQSLMPSCSQSSEFGQLLGRVNKLRGLYSFIDISMRVFSREELKNTMTEKDLYKIILYGMTYPEEMNKFLSDLLNNKWLNFFINIKMKLLQEIKSMFNKYPESLYLSDEFRESCQIIIQKLIDKYIYVEQYQIRK